MGHGTLVALICVATATAQNAPNGRPAAAHRVTLPVPLMQCGHPAYTEEARLAHLAGSVTMSLTIDDEGMPTDIHVVTPLGLGLDESAVACMSQSRYSPAQKDGKPVAYQISVSLLFDDRWDSDWHLGAAAFRTAPGAVRPVVLKSAFPATSPNRRNLSICLHLTVDKSGAPRDVQVAAPQDAKLDKEAIGIVAAWLFRPGTQSGRPVDVPASLTLVHSGSSRAEARREPE